jgi:hypothetical protein
LSVLQSFKFFFCLDDLCTQLISLSLQLFSFLRGLNHVVSLSVFSFAAIRSVSLLDKRFVLDSQVLDFGFSLSQFNSNLMPFILNGLVLCQKHIPMHLNFLFSLLHGHFQLVFLIFQCVYVISSPVKTLLNLLDLKLHDVMLDQNIFLFLCDLAECLDCHVVLQ